MKIVVVDDDPALIQLVELVLKNAGHEVITSPGGVAVLSEIKRDKTDLVITDLMMAEMDGLELCRAVTQEASLNTKVIMITARTDEMWETRAKEAGAIGLIVKPFDPMKFASQVDEILAAS